MGGASPGREEQSGGSGVLLLIARLCKSQGKYPGILSPPIAEPTPSIWAGIVFKPDGLVLHRYSALYPDLACPSPDSLSEPGCLKGDKTSTSTPDMRWCILLALASAATVLGQAAPKPPGLSFLYSINVTMSHALSFGDVVRNTSRSVIPMSGGQFQGPKLIGKCNQPTIHGVAYPPGVP